MIAVAFQDSARILVIGPWRLQIARQLDAPLVEPPLAAMTAPGASKVAAGSFYDIDTTGTGRVTHYRQSDGTFAFRLEDFFVSPTADLELHLSPLEAPKTSDQFMASPSELVVPLDLTAGSMNYPSRPASDPTQFSSVVVWCGPINSAYAGRNPWGRPMTATAPAAPLVQDLPKPRPEITFRGKRIPVILPKWSDPRLKLSATIWTITFLGLTVLDFQVSIPQTAVTVLLCAFMETGVTYHREQVLVWPASALQTGISVAFIFRVAGTQHGDWWSLRGVHLFALVALMSLLPKYLIRHNDRHIFNPSNIGLAWALLLIGPSHVFSEHLWWAPLGAPILVAFAVIVGGAFWVLRQVRMIPLAAVFLATFLPLIALFALFGRTYWAAWHDGPVGGSFYWLTIALSPELLIFVFFMITDPQTAPRNRLGRLIYAALTAAVCAGLVVVQSTEFGIKVPSSAHWS